MKGPDGKTGFFTPEGVTPGYTPTVTVNADGSVTVTFTYPDGTTSTTDFVPDGSGGYKPRDKGVSVYTLTKTQGEVIDEFNKYWEEHPIVPTNQPNGPKLEIPFRF